MPEVTLHAPGAPAWLDLATSDPEGARAFMAADDADAVAGRVVANGGRVVLGPMTDRWPAEAPARWTTRRCRGR